MKVIVDATLRVPVTFNIDVDADTLGEISSGDLASIEDAIRDRLADAEGAANGAIEVTVTDNDLNCYYDSEIDM